MKIRIFLSIIFFACATHSVSAQEVTPTITPSPTPVSYALPYPGVLPGHPMYGLKVFRDRMMDFLISNPLKKAEHSLLQSDKQLQATLLLIEQKKDEKTILTTLVTVENDFEKAIMRAQEAKQQGMETIDFVAKLALANKKHQEVLVGIRNTTKGNIREEALKQYERALKFEKTVSKQSSQ